MKKIFNKIFISLCLIPPTYFLSINTTSCHTNEETQIKSIDGRDWDGLTKGSFAENDYMINQNEHTITYLNGISIHSLNLIIPSYVSWNGTKLKVLLGEKCFKNNSGLAGSVRLNDFIRMIPDECFFGCSSITSIIFTKKPTHIGSLAFAQVPLLSDLYILQDGKLSSDWASNIHYIGDFAFYNCIVLHGDIVLGSDCYYIGDYAFNNCASIDNVDLQFCSILTQINEGTFAASGIKKLYLPPHLKLICDGAFKWCTSLILVNVPVKGMSIEFGRNAFFGCEMLASFSDVINVTKIGEGCFSFDSNLDFPIWYPEYQLSQIAGNAFSSCGFASLKFYPNGSSDVCDYAFSDNDKLNFLDFSAFTVADGAPKWSGRHIFAGADPDGGTILFSENNRFDEEWRQFFIKNDINLSENKWHLITTKQPIDRIIEPEKKEYRINWVGGKQTIEFDLFSFENTDSFDPELLNVQCHFIPSKQGESIVTKTRHEIDLNNKTIKVIIDVSDSTVGTFITKPIFFYESRKIAGISSNFTVHFV